MDKYGLLWMSSVWYGWVWFGVDEFGLVWMSLVWSSWVQFGMDEFGLVWLSSVGFYEVDFLKCSRSASQLSFTNLFKKWVRIESKALLMYVISLVENMCALFGLAGARKHLSLSKHVCRGLLSSPAVSTAGRGISRDLLQQLNTIPTQQLSSQGQTGNNI